MEKQRIVYYDNELTDDFAGNNIHQKSLGDDFVYLHKNIFWRLGAWLAYYLIATPILGSIGFAKFHVKVQGRKNLRKVRKQGFFVYGNHSIWADSFLVSTTVVRPRRAYIIADDDAVSIPGLKNFVQMIGAIPVPDTYVNYRKFLDTVDTMIKKRRIVIIFPEAHIWPYYTGLRNFPATSFHYPVQLNTPSIAVAATWRKPKKTGKKPKILLHVSNPFYPDTSLPRKEAEIKLRQEIYDFLNSKVSSPDNYEYIKYVKREPSRE